MFTVYILHSFVDKELYIGFTENLHRRLEEHQLGKVPSTSPRRPFRLIFYEVYLSRRDSTLRRMYFKTR